MSDRQAEAKQAELAKEKQLQDALNSDTVAVDFARPTKEVPPTQPHTASTQPPSSVLGEHLEKSDTAKTEDEGNGKPPSKDAVISKCDFDTYDGKLYRVFEGSVFEGVVTNLWTAVCPVPFCSCSPPTITHTTINNFSCLRDAARLKRPGRE